MTIDCGHNGVEQSRRPRFPPTCSLGDVLEGAERSYRISGVDSLGDHSV